jgi:hypothetical protein
LSVCGQHKLSTDFGGNSLSVCGQGSAIFLFMPLSHGNSAQNHLLQAFRGAVYRPAFISGNFPFFK